MVLYILPPLDQDRQTVSKNINHFKTFMWKSWINFGENSFGLQRKREESVTW
jgi:hypothetical protein